MREDKFVSRVVLAVALFQMVLSATSAEAISMKQRCRLECVDEIAACIGSGERPSACRKQTIRSCKREGLSVCEGEGVACCLGEALLAGARVSLKLYPPASLTAAASSTDSIDLAWVDTNSRESGYTVKRSLVPDTNFAPVATLGKDTQSYRDSGLAPNTTYYYCVQAFGRRHSVSAYSSSAQATTQSDPMATSTTTSTTVGPSATTTTTILPGEYAVRSIYGKDSSPTGFDLIVGAGATAVDRGSYREYLDDLPPGIKGVVWLGNYDNTTCSWQKSDDWIRSHVSAVSGHPAIAAYYVADEPHVWECSTAPDQVKKRSDLVKSLDPRNPTFVVIEPHSPGNPYSPYVGTADIIGVERYPCSHKNGCVMSKIDDAVSLAEQAGVPRYWGIPRGDGDENIVGIAESPVGT